MSTLQDGGAKSLAIARLPNSIYGETTKPASRAGVPVAARDVGKRFGAKRVLNGLSLSLGAGEFVAIVGRSGCGKSTFLRLLAGLDDDFEGDIGFGQERRARQADDVRVMFQEPRLLPWATVLDNVAIGLGEAGTQKQRRAAAARTLEAVGLGDRAQEWPTVLSGGQRQRVALARALVSGPAVLALDEPLGALDALTRIEMQALIEGIWLERGFTALMVTHDVGEAVALADRVVLIEDGRVTIDVPVDLPRPRRRGDPRFAALEDQLLERLLQR